MRYSVAMENRGQVYADKIADIIEARRALIQTQDGLPRRFEMDKRKAGTEKYGDIHRHEVKHTGTDYIAALKAIAEEKHASDGDEVRARTDEQATAKGKASLH